MDAKKTVTTDGDLTAISKIAYEMFITWSPNPKGCLYGLHTPKRQRGAIQFIIDLLPYIGDGYYVCEFTKNGNIHLHILMNIKNYARYYGRLLPTMKREGNVNAQAVRDIQNVHKYMAKDITIIKILLKEDGFAVFAYTPKYKRRDKESLITNDDSEID